MSLVANDSCVEPRFAPMSQSDDWIIRQAIALLEQRVFKKGPSLERPAAVKDYLVGKGVEANRVYTEGKGKKQPVTGTSCKNLGKESGKNKKLVDCLQPDRRVEIEVIGTK